jgi:dipeptidase E
MSLFLTSSAFTEDSSQLNPANGFVCRLRAVLPNRPLRVVYITSNPDDGETNAIYSEVTRNAIQQSDFAMERFVMLDRQTMDQAPMLVSSADLIFLSGGHVPTQNRFFKEMNLRSLLFDHLPNSSVIIGSSAGSMNSADPVYAMPELEGEASDPSFKRVLSGLGLTSVHIIPHLELTRYEILDGLRLFEDILFEDSRTMTLHAMPDGSYAEKRDGTLTFYGETHEIRAGVMRKICEDGNYFVL